MPSVQSVNIERGTAAESSISSPSGSLPIPDQALPPSHMPPEALGVESPTQSQSQSRNATEKPRPIGTLAEVNSSARKRQNMAIKSIKSQAAVAAAAEGISTVYSTESTSSLAKSINPSMLTFVSYKGMEVFFSTVHGRVCAVCSRTHVIFQTLDLPTKSPVVSIASNTHSGMVVIVQQDGFIQTYFPHPTAMDEPDDFIQSKEAKDDEFSNTDNNDIIISSNSGSNNNNFNSLNYNNDNADDATFGRFHWLNGPTMNIHEIFYRHEETVRLLHRRSGKPGEFVDVSLSCDSKVLVAHKDQLAVFDAVPTLLDDQERSELSTSRVLWTSKLPSKIHTAKIAGDGQALVVVLEPGDNVENGVCTYVRDSEDGSQDPLTRPMLERAASVGILYKPGPFLQHNAPVTRVSFRGLGHNTSCPDDHEGEGNDLLLTYCSDDSSVRVFNQNSWQQLMHWTTPPNSRADWIKGCAAFSLGDLETHKKYRKGGGSKPPSRHPSSASLSELPDGGGNIVASAVPTNGPNMGGPRGMTSHPTPTSAAGAWIAEITFRNAFPALRLSRLSYMKRGNDGSQPALFESVAAILPAGSIVAGCVLGGDDSGLSIQGIWPAWNPLLSANSNSESKDTPSGSAMTFLGLSSSPTPSSAYFGDSYLGGTHSPPSELRIMASHPQHGKVIIMEFPLWGDEEFGAMEIGSPVRAVLSLADVHALSSKEEQYPQTQQQQQRNPPATKNQLRIVDSIDYESSRLCAKVNPKLNSIVITWRKQGTMNMRPSAVGTETNSRVSSLEIPNPSTPDNFNDLSVIPAPLSLPPLRLPTESGTSKDQIKIIRWWPDESFGGPPIMVAFTKSSKIVLFEIPPPWSALEPGMPNYDPFGTGSAAGSVTEMYESVNEMYDSDDESGADIRQEYEVMVVPHPDFGIGLRLESPVDGLPAVAGSFKKHPLTGGNLPAEKTGMIMLGDELLSVNGVSLEHLSFDDIIATVRHVGAESGPGEGLCLRFRPVSEGGGRRRKGTGSFMVNGSSPPPITEAPSSDTNLSGRRTMEQMLGVSPRNRHRKDSHGNTSNHGASSRSECGSLTSLLVGSSSELQQEFGRVLAVIPKVFSSTLPAQDCLLLIPWSSHASSSKLRCSALLVCFASQNLLVKRIDVPHENRSASARVLDLGSTKISSNGGNGNESVVRIHLAEVSGDSIYVVLVGSRGSVSLCRVTVNYSVDTASFQQYEQLFTVKNAESTRIRCASIGLMATTKPDENGIQNKVQVWSARSHPDPRKSSSSGLSALDKSSIGDFWEAQITLESDDPSDQILDFCFLSTGCLDAFPSLVLLSCCQAVVFQRREQSLCWAPIIKLSYPELPGSMLSDSWTKTGPNDESYESPLDIFPHILCMLRSTIISFDEQHSLRSDWHPESLLAMLCTEEQGAKLALKNNIRSMFLWLAQEMHKEEEGSDFVSSPLIVAPYENVDSEVPLKDCDNNNDEKEKDESKNGGAFDLMSSFATRRSTNEPAMREDDKLLNELLSALGQPRRSQLVNTAGRSYEFKVAMLSTRTSLNSFNEEDDDVKSDKLPTILKALNDGELTVLWALCNVAFKPPSFKALDTTGQLALLVNVIYRSIKDSPQSKAKPLLKSSSSLISDGPTFLIKRQSSRINNGSEPKLPTSSASSGCLAALLSDYQGQLLDCLRISGSKLDWPTARSMRLPFWLRSDDKLRQISEEIGQNFYRESKDILKSALFFIMAGKLRTLKNLAAADPTDSGTKFFKFMTSHDFTSERGRRAAEKNAFSLLRKHQYETAAAFFLLAEPPILKSAVETIATKMEDIDLAFMIGRLVENRTPPTQSSQGMGFGLGIGGGFGGGSLGGFGGGGGYAGSGTTDETEVTADEVKFSDWEPKLGNCTKELLTGRGLPASLDDSCFSAIQLMWMGKKTQASLWLCGVYRCSNDIESIETDIVIPRISLSSSLTLSTENKGDVLIRTTNNFINFVACPFLLKSMKARLRTRHTSAFVVSNALTRIGIEIPSIRAILHNIKDEDFATGAEKEDDNYCNKAQHTRNKNSWEQNTGGSSSIFDSYDTAAPVPAPKAKKSDGQATSSIFDTFDVAAPVKPKPFTTGSNAASMSSSIFDSFDPAPPTKQKPGVIVSSKAQSGQMTSSIFDSFDTAPSVAKPKTKPTSAKSSNSGAMSSSIFDGFDAAPQKSRTKTNPTTTTTNSQSGGIMSSSIFDGFDAAPKPKSVKAVTQSGQMSSSIFDSFNTAPPPPQRQRKAVASSNDTDASANGEMNSSIFDSFDTTTTAQQTKSSTRGMKSSQENVKIEQEETEKEEVLPALPAPKIWLEWRHSVIKTAAARRLIREVARISSQFHGDPVEIPITPHNLNSIPIIPPNSAQVLQFHGEGEELVAEVRSCVDKIKDVSGLSGIDIVKSALQLLDAPYHYHRVVFAVLLHLATKRADLAEDVVRNVSQSLIQRCNAMSFCGDDIGRDENIVSTRYLRRYASHLSWQLELCLWLHRGAALPLSGCALNEAIVAVRVGLLVASWNKDFECIETMIRQPPDCLMDHDAGRQLWTSLKIISNTVEQDKKKGGGASSGGWEFLVDCSRSEATELLRKRKTGCFIIRPHADDHGVFTLSFKTNLIPTTEETGPNGDDGTKSPDGQKPRPNRPGPRAVRKDDVVQHAIIRLSDSGFRCGSFGPFATLMKLLEAVSSSLPFDLRFDQPPTEGVIKEEGSKPSPNTAFFRKLALCHAENLVPRPPLTPVNKVNDEIINNDNLYMTQNGTLGGDGGDLSRGKLVEQQGRAGAERKKRFGIFLQLLVLSEIRKQLSCIVCAKYENLGQFYTDDDDEDNDTNNDEGGNDNQELDEDSVGSLSNSIREKSAEVQYITGSRVLRPLLTWCRMMEVSLECDLAPMLHELSPDSSDLPVSLSASENAIELSAENVPGGDVGDSVIRRMIQPGSGVEFRTLRLGDGGESAMVVLFNKHEAVSWFVQSGTEMSETEALARLKMMEANRVIEIVDIRKLAPKAYAKLSKDEGKDDGTQDNTNVEGKRTRYRFVDPWEVEPLDSREAETRGAALGRHKFLAFSLGRVASSCEAVFRALGGLHLLELWATTRGGVALTKALASVHPPWERSAGGDLLLVDGSVAEPTAYANSIRQHLYRNALFRRLSLPQRFLALIQVELLDLKNLTSPGGSLNLSVYALLRLKRLGSGAPLKVKARTLDSVATQPTKLGKSTGPNAPASWGSLVRFRYPLPEYVGTDGKSFDDDREALFRGPPSVLQVSVYEKKFMSDTFLGDAGVKLDGLSSGGQLEEWVPLRTEIGINWFARIRLTLRFELMCIADPVGDSISSKALDELAPSVGLRRIQQLSQAGGALEDPKKSVSTPDLLSYFESMVH